MKRPIKYIKITTQATLLFCLIYCFSACVKSRYGGTDFSTLQPVVLIPEGGLSAFGSQALLFPGTDAVDTAYFHVNYAATGVAPEDETITLAIDPAALASYNGSNTAQYTIFPDSIFSFTSTTVTVKKGNNYSDAIPLIVFPSKVDPSLNLMLPITIKVAPKGSTISSNFSTIYFHLIGNPLAGPYNVVGTRYSYPGTIAWSGPPAAIPAGYSSTVNLDGVKVAAPDNSVTVELPFANLGGNGAQYVYKVTALPDYSAIDNVDYGFDAIYSNIVSYKVSYTPPAPGQKVSFHIMTHYNNALAGAGRDRIIDEFFTHQ